MATLNLTVVDPTGLLAGVPLLQPTLRAALHHIEQYLTVGGMLDVEVRVDATATGRISAVAGMLTTTTTVAGLQILEPGALTETRTGVDFDPSRAEIIVTVDPRSDYVVRELWWDAEIATSLAGRVPSDRTDAFSILLHELLHGLGITTYRDLDTAALSTPYGSMWDALIQLSGGQARFTGANTRALLGADLEVRVGGSQGAQHLGAGATPQQSQQAFLEATLMNSWSFRRGERYTLDRLDLAILQDLGWSLKPSSLTDVVQRWDTGEAARYLVGYAGSDVLLGGSLGDRLEGRGGDDSLTGGAGLDLAAFSGPRAAYRVAAQTGGHRVTDTLAGRDGVDTLAGIERLKFSDMNVALDLDGAAGLTARLLGAVFGAASVRNAQYVGIGLGLFDAGQSADQVARLAIEARLGPAPSNRDLVTLLYTNVIGVAPSAAEVTSFASLIESGSFTPAGLTLYAAGTDFNAASIGLAGLASGGIDYLPA